MTLDNIVVIALSFLLLAGIAYAMVLYKELKKSEAALVQALSDKLLLLDQLGTELTKSAFGDTNDSFVKFLTDSRGSAFEYIENAQQTILEFLVVADKMPVARSTPKDMVKAYKEAYSKLIDLLPVPANGND
jgi:hypothetical protein